MHHGIFLMRFALAVALMLAACGASNPPADGPPAPEPAVEASVDTGPSPDMPAPDAPPDTSRPDVARPDAAAPDVAEDAAPDAPSPPDVARDAPPDVVRCGGEFLHECDIDGVVMCVNVSTGRMRSDGTILHCGGCGMTCAAGQLCIERRCRVPM